MSAKSVSTQPDGRIDRARIQKLAARFTETGDSPARVVASGVGFSPASISRTKSPKDKAASKDAADEVVENSNLAGNQEGDIAQSKTKKRKRGKSTSQTINAALIEHSDRYGRMNLEDHGLNFDDDDDE